MDLPRDGIEYAHIVFGELPFNTAVEASVDRAVWTPLTITGNEALFLVRGPDSTATTGTVVPYPSAPLWVRVVDTPEQVVRQAGVINLY